MIVGLDTNIICYALDDDYPENKMLNDLLLNLSPEYKIAINPTTIHEAYHVLVYGHKWFPEEAAKAIGLLLKNPYTEFYNDLVTPVVNKLNALGKNNIDVLLFCYGIDDLVARMKKEGVNVTDEPFTLDPGGSRIAFIEDPDGTLVELIEKIAKAGGPGQSI